MTNPIDLLGLLALVNRRREDGEARGAGPLEMAAPCEPEDMGRLRSLWCPVYDRCLDEAHRRRWRSWSCESCALFQYARPFRALESVRASSGHAFDPNPGEGSRFLGL
jgi:hypothetical protein